MTAGYNNVHKLLFKHTMHNSMKIRYSLILAH